MERGILRSLYERPLDSLLATFGLAVIIRQVIQLLYTANPRRATTPSAARSRSPDSTCRCGAWVIVIATSDWSRSSRRSWPERTSGFEPAPRPQPDARRDDRDQRGLMRAALFAIGSAIAGLAGRSSRPSTPLTRIRTAVPVNSFLVVILGGQGSLRGLVVAAAVLGGSLSILQFAVSTVAAQIIVLVIAILAVRVRPILAERIAAYRDRRSSTERSGPGSAGTALPAEAPGDG